MHGTFALFGQDEVDAPLAVPQFLHARAGWLRLTAKPAKAAAGRAVSEANATTLLMAITKPNVASACRGTCSSPPQSIPAACSAGSTNSGDTSTLTT
jgi:hypothetical protein